MLPTKIAVIGAGSASFGLNTLAALMRSERLSGSHLALVDRNPAALEPMARLAARLNREWRAGMTLTSHTHHEGALDGAAFVVSAIEVPPREQLWRMDYEIPLRFGVRQPYAENSGPGGFAHALRNIGPVMEIVRAMEQICPDAWFVNFSNPLMRICDAVARYSRVKVVGLCHGILIGYGLVGTLLQDYLEVSPHVDAGERWMQSFQRSVDRLDIRAAGLNHFIWMLGLHDRQTGEDLYPLLREKAAALPADQMPLNRQLLQTFGLFPLLDASHLCEYLPWMSDPVTRSWEKYGIHLWDWDAAEKGREQGHAEIARMADGRMEIDYLRSADSEGALEIVENIAAAGTHYHLAVNLPNRGYIANLPDGAIVELPGVVSGSGVHGIGMGSLPEPIAELCRREISVMRLCVDAAIHGDRQSALQCLLLDPVMRDIDTAQQILDAYLDAYREHLPQFWR